MMVPMLTIGLLMSLNNASMIFINGPNSKTSSSLIPATKSKMISIMPATKREQVTRRSRNSISNMKNQKIVITKLNNHTRKKVRVRLLQNSQRGPWVPLKKQLRALKCSIKQWVSLSKIQIKWWVQLTKMMNMKIWKHLTSPWVDSSSIQQLCYLLL